jgi:hypothetical protein
MLRIKNEIQHNIYCIATLINIIGYHIYQEVNYLDTYIFLM